VYVKKELLRAFSFTHLSCEAERIPRPGIAAKHLTVSASDITLGQVCVITPKKQQKKKIIQNKILHAI